jgi:hypothetical protein
MDDLSPETPESPRPPARPRHLPRIAYKPPEPSPEPEDDGPNPVRPPLARLRSRKTAEAPAAPGPEKVLKEDTPALDTAENRRRARLILGAVLGSVIVFSLVVIVRTLTGSGDEPMPTMEPIPAPPPVDPAESARMREAQANMLLEEAHSYDAKGQPDLALRRLDRVATAYPQTVAGREAKAEFERRARGGGGDAAGAVGASAEATKPRTLRLPDPNSVRGPALAGSGSPAPATIPAAPAGTGEPPTPATTPPPSGSGTAEIAPPPSNPAPAVVPPAPGGGAAASKALPPGFRAHEAATIHPSGWPTVILCERDGSVMRLVPAGGFLMGDDHGSPAEKPAHPVSLSTFYVDEHEVTNAQYFGMFRAASAVDPPPADAPKDERPAVNVSLDEAGAYAAWAGKSLPTEAQWEKAARGVDGRPFPWGPSPPRWERPRQPRQIDPVGSFPSDVSPFGVVDAAGNAWEWTSDWFEAGAFGRFVESPVADPTGPDRTHSRIAEVTVKGGSSEWKVAWRSGMRPEARLPYLGFRCVLQVARDAPKPAESRRPVGSPKGFNAPKGEPVPF